MLYGKPKEELPKKHNLSLNPYFFGKCSTASSRLSTMLVNLRVLILIFLENALRPFIYLTNLTVQHCLNPYFFGKCSTAYNEKLKYIIMEKSLNPYFFGKCSTATEKSFHSLRMCRVLILIFLENALRHLCTSGLQRCTKSLNPYFFGKCSTANNPFGEIKKQTKS